MRRRFLKGVNVRVEERVVELRWRWKASGRESVGYTYWYWKLADEGLGEREKYLVK
jgi:hypothetical protein